MFDVQLKGIVSALDGLCSHLVYNRCVFLSSLDDTDPVFTLPTALERLQPTPTLIDKIFISTLCIGHSLWFLSVAINVYDTIPSPILRGTTVVCAGMLTSLILYSLQQTFAYPIKRAQVEKTVRQAIDRLWKDAEATITTLQEEIRAFVKIGDYADRERFIDHIQSSLDLLDNNLKNCTPRLNQYIHTISSANPRLPMPSFKAAVNYLRPNGVNKIVVPLLCLSAFVQMLGYAVIHYATISPIALLGRGVACYAIFNWHKKAYWRLYPSLPRQSPDEMILASIAKQEENALRLVTAMKEKASRIHKKINV
jgi:hypothetical protein